MTTITMSCTKTHLEGDALKELKTLRERVELQRRELARLNRNHDIWQGSSLRKSRCITKALEYCKAAELNKLASILRGDSDSRDESGELEAALAEREKPDPVWQRLDEIAREVVQLNERVKVARAVDSVGAVEEKKSNGVADESRDHEVGEGDSRVSPHGDAHDRKRTSGKGDSLDGGRTPLERSISKGKGRLSVGGNSGSTDNGTSLVSDLEQRASEAIHCSVYDAGEPGEPGAYCKLAPGHEGNHFMASKCPACNAFMGSSWAILEHVHMCIQCAAQKQRTNETPTTKDDSAHAECSYAVNVADLIRQKIESGQLPDFVDLRQWWNVLLGYPKLDPGAPVPRPQEPLPVEVAKPGVPGWVHRLDALCPFCGRRCGEHDARHEIGFHCSFPRSGEAGPGCTAGDGVAIPCRHCGAPAGRACAEQQRLNDGMPKREGADGSR